MTTDTAEQRRAPTVDAAGLPERVHALQEPLYLGFIGLITVEVVVFSTLASSYLYLAATTRDWPPFGVKPPALLLPTINTGLLLVSAWLVHLADAGVRRGRQGVLKLGVAGGAALATLFLILKGVEYSELDYRWDTHVYGSIVWTISGLHAFHVLSLVLKTFVVEALALRGYFDERRFIGVQVNGLYFIFVALVWLPLYAVLYFAPRLLS